MTALDKLIEAVEAVTADHSDFAAMFPYPICDHAREAHHGSLDAALALHEALLPGWHFNVAVEANKGGYIADASNPEWTNCRAAHASTPARAWLLAILRAYRSVQA